jgi:MYXO-CTERM domain-containing protein
MRSVKLVAILGSLVSAAVAQADPLFSESFENGSANWLADDGNPVGITADDTTACSTSFQHETAATAGRSIATAAMSVAAGDYCLSAWVRASSDASPFVGLATADADANLLGYRWLIGSAGFDDGSGDQIARVTGDEAWHWYAASVTLDASVASLSVVDEILGSAGYADFDDIQLSAGPCEPGYAGADQHQVCVADAVCTASGACQSSTPPGDMGGGPSSTPDMGGTSSPFPAGNQVFTPSTPPVAAEGTPSGSGAVNATAGGGGGCSMGGQQGQRSAGIMMLAFAVVLFVARRRRA